MAQSTVTQDGIQLVVPGTYVSTNVQSGASGAATAGIVTIVGEADQGPAFIDETDLNNSVFTPSQYNQVVQKYVSGNIVDAFRALITAANDPAIVGAVNQVRIVKTNPSTAADATITSNGLSFATLTADTFGAAGNLIKYRSQVATAELAPSTGSMSYTPDYASHAANFIVNGTATESVSIPSKTSLAALASAIESIADGILVSGQSEILPVAALVGITLSASTANASTLTLSLPAGQVFAGSPAVGDSIVIPATGDFGATANSVISNSGASNIGTYIISAVVNSPASASLTLALANAPVGMTLSAQSGTIVASQRDVILYKPFAVNNYTGEDRHAMDGLAGTFTTVISGPNVTVTPPASWTVSPRTGDIVKLSSSFAGINPGFYLVSSASANSLVMVRQSIGAAGTSGSATVGTINSGNAPFIVLKPAIDGLGKSLEMTGDLQNLFKDPALRSAAATINTVMFSAAELRNTMTVSRNAVSESFTSGGNIVIKVGSSLPSPTLTVGTSSITLSSNATVILTAAFSQFPTLQNMVDLINSQTGFSASLGSAKYANISPSALDEGTYGLATNLSAQPARIKNDAASWLAAINGSTLVSATLIATGGLPETVTPDQFLTGGTKAGTTAAQVVAAIDACQSLDTNFIVPLFSRDASLDIADGLTDSSSTYTVDAINAYTQAHVLLMSQVKMRKNRIAIVSKQDTYVNVKEAAGELVSFRVALAFQSFKNVSAAGVITTYQPWMSAIIAAGMQAAAGYKGIVKKFANISGVVAQPDFDASNPGDLEDGLEAGLLIMERVNTGGFRWVSDQTTYSVDNNFVYNSLQAVYLADLMTYSLIATFDLQLVGKSVAEISAQAALAILEAAMFNFLRQKWIAPSDDGAPKGFKNASVQITGGVCSIAVEAKLAGILYFAPIAFTLSEVQQSASSS
jgi:hypothetical protein